MDDKQTALLLACMYHKDQVDKSGVPYIDHPLAVSKQVLPGAQEIVAILHDIVEDTECSLDILREFFPEEIVEAVDAITKRETVWEPTPIGYKEIKRETRREYLERVKENPIALAVKFADIWHNSSPERLANLKPDVAKGFEKMYKKDLKILQEPLTCECAGRKKPNPPPPEGAKKPPPPPTPPPARVINEDKKTSYQKFHKKPFFKVDNL